MLIRRHDKTSKYQSPVQKAELVHCNPQYAEVRLSDGRETTVSLRDVAPYSDVLNASLSGVSVPVEDPPGDPAEDSLDEESTVAPAEESFAVPEVRRSSRLPPPPIDRLGYPKI